MTLEHQHHQGLLTGQMVGRRRLLAWGGLMSAAAILMAIPVILLSTVAQRVMVEGLTAGSVKG